MYKCVDLIANAFGKNSETSFFEGRQDYISPLQYKGVVNIAWLLAGSEFGMKELKEDCRSVSIIPTSSKMFERIMFVQISAYMFSQNINADFGKAIVLNIAI